MERATITYDRGSILATGEIPVPHAKWDNRVNAFRAQALYYSDLIEFLKRSQFQFQDQVQDPIPCPALACKLKLRTYQQKALEAWNNAGRRGTIVLPTGSGKTVIAVKAIADVSQPSIIVAPTLDLVAQWKRRLEEELGVEVGVVGGGEYHVRAVTVSTYDSAYLRAAELGNKFNLLIFDEVHHLPAEGYRQIAEMFTAPYRMGLTATLERQDMMHKEIPRLVGGIVFQLGPETLAPRYLAEYKLDRINLDLTDMEQEEYDRNYQVFTDYLEKTGARLTSPQSFQRFIMRTTRNPEARRALLGRNRAMDIAYNSEAKLDKLGEILRGNPDDRILIFTQHNQLVHRISKRYLIPYITHRSGKEERAQVLSGFQSGRYRAVVTSKVLDEGIDVPEASLGIIVSGTGSRREFIQRLGRLLRKKHGKLARLIELVSTETTEGRTSSRRKKGLSRDSASDHAVTGKPAAFLEGGGWD